MAARWYTSVLLAQPSNRNSRKPFSVVTITTIHTRTHVIISDVPRQLPYLRMIERDGEVRRLNTLLGLGIEVHTPRPDTHAQGGTHLAVPVGHEGAAHPGYSTGQRLEAQVDVDGIAPPGVGEAGDGEATLAVKDSLAVLDLHALVLHPVVLTRHVPGVVGEGQVQDREAHCGEEEQGSCLLFHC